MQKDVSLCAGLSGLFPLSCADPQAGARDDVALVYVLCGELLCAVCAIVQNVAVTDKYGFSSDGHRWMMMLCCPALMKPGGGVKDADLRQSEPKDSMADTRGTLLPMVAMDMMRRRT